MNTHPSIKHSVERIQREIAMSKPEDIPQDVWDAANMAVVHAPEYTQRLHEDVARALMRERERGGKIATDQAEREPYGHCKATAYFIADSIMGGP